MAEVTSCGICGCSFLREILNLGDQPVAERFDQDARYPLRLLECRECHLVQLSYIVPQAELFPRDHPYASGNSRALREHFGRLAASLEEGLGHDDLVIDIGANDGTLLASYAPRRKIGIEPTDQALKCRAKGILTYQEFFTASLAKEIARLHGTAKVITATNVLAHVPFPHDFMIGVAILLADDGVFVTENHDLASVTNGLQIDTVYHEHLRYYSVTSLSRLLAMNGLEVISSARIGTHGGSFRVLAGKRHQDLQARAADAGMRLNDMVAELSQGGEVIYGIGAATRAVPLIHFAALAPYITCVCEVTGSEKIGLCMPGTAVPVVDEKRLIEDQPGYALLFSWHLAGDIIPKLRQAGYRGKFIVPLPEPQVTEIG